ncbi:MAG: type II secretion system protein [Bdellovibrionales bacterium]
MRKGFTLIEMSFVLVIVGMIIVMVFPALKAIHKSTQYTATQTNLSTLMRAAAAFTHAHGCLPCPTPAAPSTYVTPSSGFGHVRGDSSGTMCGTCSTAEGIPPFMSMGLPAATAKDGYGRWITMSIDPKLAENSGTLPPTAPCTASDGSSCLLDHSQKGLCAAGLDKSKAPQVRIHSSSNTEPKEFALIFLSHGENGYGAFRIDSSPTNNMHNYNGPASSCSLHSGFEICNTDNDRVFVDAEHKNTKKDPFDDILYYLDRNALIALLGNHVCETTW